MAPHRTSAHSFEPYTKQMEVLVKTFNARLQAGGETHYRFRETYLPDYPPEAGRSLYQQSILLVQGGEVRGGYTLKYQKFVIRGAVEHIACGPQLPLSEGIVNPRYGMNGLLLLSDALSRQPLLFALGMGGLEEPFPKLLKADGWPIFAVPFYFKIVEPARFLENINYLKNGRARALLLDLMRRTGIGQVGIRIAQLRLGRADPSVHAEPVAEFGPWADALWAKCADKYSFCAVRDRETMSCLYPRDSRFIRLHVSRQGESIGWATLLDTQMSGHKFFGDMHVGSIIDCLALPEDATAVVRAAAGYLEARRPDLIVSNQASAAWRRALVANGFLRGPSNYLLAISKPLAERLHPLEESRSGIHINRGDGDGPVNINL